MSAFTSWPPAPPNGGSSGTASDLATTGAPVDISGAAPPVAGQVLTATDATHAEWRVPGLKYDPAIRFNVNAGGEATIEPGTWGFVYTAPEDASEINIFVVSSLTAPPVDSRFGLYVSPSVTLPVTVSLIGASQIMGIDGTLNTTITLLPGAMYEWVFYHEDGAAIWGLVSQTLNPLRTVAETVANALTVDYVITAPSALSGNSGVYDGVTVANDHYVLLTAQTDPTQNGFWLTHDGPWTRAVGYPAPPDVPVGQGAAALNGITQAGALWAHVGNNDWVAVTLGAGPTKSLATTGAAVNIAAGAPPSAGQVLIATDATHAAFAALPVATTTANGVMSSADKVKLSALSYDSKDSVNVVATTNITLSGVQTIDGTSGTAGDRVLCVAQTSTAQNGIWIMSAGAWSRASDADSGTKVTRGMRVSVVNGAFNQRTQWILATADPITVDTTPLTFSLCTGPRSISTPVPVGASQAGSAGTLAQWASSDHIHLLVPGHNGLNGFRIGGSTNLPTDGTFSNVVLASHTGNRIALFDGSNWVSVVLSGGVSLGISGQTAGIPCDVFVLYANLSAASLVLTPWSNATTRATAIAQSSGVWVKSGTPGQRYVGTFLPDSATTFTVRGAGSGATKAVCGIWNQDNRLRLSYTWGATFATWSPSAGSTWEAFGGGSGPHIEYVLGQASNESITTRAIAAVDTGSAGAALGIGFDSTTSPAGFRHSVAGSGLILGVTTDAVLRVPNLGRHVANMLGYGTTTAPVFQGLTGAMSAGLVMDLFA